jgi:uncharacterized protein YdeI (YjbR/CyaY-like superfamily)
VSIVPKPETIRAFKSEKAFETWLARHHDKESELYLRIYKKDAGVPTVSYAQALDVALCWGWIDGLKKSYDAQSFLQRFTPRRSKSLWSQINREHVARLVAAGRMTPHGHKHVEAAQRDGRWDAAYASPKHATMPDDLRAAIAKVPKAEKTFATLSKANQYALSFRLHHLKTEAGRQKSIARFVAMLARGETLHPNGKPVPAAATKTKRKKSDRERA